MYQSGVSAFYTVVRWHKLHEVDNESTLHNSIILAICEPKITTFSADLTKVLTKTSWVIFWHALYLQEQKERMQTKWLKCYFTRGAQVQRPESVSGKTTTSYCTLAHRQWSYHIQYSNVATYFSTTGKQKLKNNPAEGTIAAQTDDDHRCRLFALRNEQNELGRFMYQIYTKKHRPCKHTAQTLGQ